MGSLYPGTSVSGYNSNPPPDDGTTGANNQITWSGVKSKLGDPLNTFAAAVDTNVTNAFNKTISGGSVVSTAVDYPATAADQGRNIVVTVSGKTVTTPDATVVHSPFVFCVNNQSTGNITVAGFGGTQNVDGAATAKLGAGKGVILWTDGANWFTSGLVMGNLPLVNPPFGFDAPLNLQLNATVGSSLLTIAVKANDGTDPTTSNPVLIPFRNATGSSGAPSWVAVTSALSISTNAVGASLGTANNVPFRIWVVAFNNGGTPVLGLWQSITGGATPSAIAALAEYSFPTTVAISAAATSAGVFYTPNGTTLTGKTFRILGFVEYQSGLATAGTYASGPNIIQLFGPGIKKPGDVIQTVYSTTTTTTTINSTVKIATSLTGSITPTSTVNLVKVWSIGAYAGASNSSIFGYFQLYRGTGSTAIGNVSPTVNSNETGAVTNLTPAGPVNCFALDNPGSVSSTQYGLYGVNANGSGTTCAVWLGTATGLSANSGSLVLEEIMG